MAAIAASATSVPRVTSSAEARRSGKAVLIGSSGRAGADTEVAIAELHGRADGGGLPGGGGRIRIQGIGPIGGAELRREAHPRIADRARAGGQVQRAGKIRDLRGNAPWQISRIGGGQVGIDFHPE